MFYAMDSAKECWHFYPTPHDTSAYLGYRRMASSTERKLIARCTINGDYDALRGENMQLAWAVVTWQGYGEADGTTEIPYDFQYDFDQETPEEQERKMQSIAKLEPALKLRLLLHIKESILRLGDDLKNFESGWRVGGASATGLPETIAENGVVTPDTGSPSPVQIVEPPASKTTNRRRAT
jgi:hypothetical protein